MDRDEVGHDDVGHPESPNEQFRLGLYNIDDHLIIYDQKIRPNPNGMILAEK